MANASFTPFKEALLDANVDLNNSAIKVALVRGYTFNTAHTFMSDITSNSGVLNGTPVALANKTVVGGVFDADDSIITTTADAAQHAIVVYQSTAVGTTTPDVAPTAQRLCFYFDTGTNLPVVPGTGTVTITWSGGAAKIYKIG